MMHALAIESASLASIVKPLVVTAVMLGWAKWAALVDKDAFYYHQARKAWNIAQAAAGMVALAAVVLIPSFPIGLGLALLLIAGAGYAYAHVRNASVPAERRWTLNLASWQQTLDARKEAAADRKAAMHFKPAANAPDDFKHAPAPDDPKYQAFLLVENMLDMALRQGAQSIDLATIDGQFATALNIDGVEYKQGKLPNAQALAAIDYLKALCGLDIADRRKKQHGSCKVEAGELGSHTLTVHTIGSTKGMQCSVLLDASRQVTLAHTELGLTEHQQAALKSLLDDPHGAVLVAAPSGHGRTTTLYTLTTLHDPYTADVHTIESTVERELEGVHQNALESSEAAAKVASLLLRDPQVLTVTNVGDGDTAKAIAKAGLKGPRIYAGVRADDAMTALKIWLKAVEEPAAVAGSLRAIIAQRLLRRLCPVCRQRYAPEPAALAKLNLPADRIKELYKAGGKVQVRNKLEVCPSCHGLGYKGRVGVFEILLLDDAARALIQSGKLDQLRPHLARHKTLWLTEASLAKVVAGVTSISEVTRVFGGHDKEG
jgi:type II secretory ATPase GspE/PulE/Tfp pilus assembly ATPase PilB-like protein